MEGLIEQMQIIAAAMEQLTLRVAAQETRLQEHSLQTAGGPIEPRVPLPEKFSGDRIKFSNFRNSCLLYFQLRPVSSGTEAQKVGVVMSLLQGDPQTWAFGLPPQDPALHSVEAFFRSMEVLYADPDQASTADSKLRNLKQGRRTAEEYCTEFRRWAVDSRWNDSALNSQFRLGLSESIKDAMVNHPSPGTLDLAMQLAIRIDRRIRERRLERSATPSPARTAFPVPTDYPPSPAPEPMQLGAAKLTEAEKWRRRSQGLCLYCGGSGHLVRTCPQKRKNLEKFQHLGGVEEIHLGSQAPFPHSDKVLLPAEVIWEGGRFSVQAFLDSGAGGNFLDQTLAESMGIPSVPLESPLRVLAIDNCLLSQGPVMARTSDLTLKVGNRHSEVTTFYLIKSPSTPLVLGLPWLRSHNPVIDWRSGQLITWGDNCNKGCLSLPLHCLAVCTEGLPKPDSKGVDVFSHRAANSFSPHRAYGCPILPPGCVLAAPLPDLKAELEQYQSESPPGKPDDLLFVPLHLRLPTLQQFHVAKSAGHLGVKKMLTLVSRHVWWPYRNRDVKAYVKACTVCAHRKRPCPPPAGMLVPSQIPKAPDWQKHYADHQRIVELSFDDVSNVFHVSLLKSAASADPRSPPPASIIKGRPEYEVDRILDS